MNEVNALIWPNRLGVGLMDPGRVQADGDDREDVQGHQEAGDEGLLPDGSREEGDRELRKPGVDVTGKSYKKTVVDLKEGGK